MRVFLGLLLWWLHAPWWLWLAYALCVCIRMGVGVAMYYLRSPEERAVLDFFRAHREAKFNVALHVRKCEGDDRDFDLMRGLMERAILGADRQPV